jgi:hypothetical protein
MRTTKFSGPKNYLTALIFSSTLKVFTNETMTKQ